LYGGAGDWTMIEDFIIVWCKRLSGFFVGCAILIFIITQTVHAEPELNTLNTIQYSKGQTIELSTRILNDADTIGDAFCGVVVKRDVDDSNALDYEQMNYSTDDGHYDYYWVPQLSFWEGIEQMWNPDVGNYHAYMNCTSGSLGDNVLNDTVVLNVVD
jgi:hypothetical protein